MDYDNINNLTENSKTIIITGGIGDFIIIDYFFNFSILYNIIFISKQSLLLKNLMIDYICPNKYFALKFDFNIINKPGFDSLEELYKYFPFLKNKFKVFQMVDCFKNMSKMVETNTVPTLNLSNNIFKKNKLIIHKFNLPDKYAVIVPYTEDNRIHCKKCNKIHTYINKNFCKLVRNLTVNDYINIYKYLTNHNLIGVLLSKIPINIPTHMSTKFINLSSNTSLQESIEITKHATHYFGIDSILSVIASKYMVEQNLFIKCNNLHGITNKHIYWYPYTNIKLYDIHLLNNIY